MDIISYIQAHWVQWVFAIISGALTLAYRSISARLKEEQKKNEAIAAGVQSLLRESIVNNYNRYCDKGCVPIYAKENIEAIFQAYSALGGNHTAKNLYEKLMSMPETKGDVD